MNKKKLNDKPLNTLLTVCLIIMLTGFIATAICCFIFPTCIINKDLNLAFMFGTMIICIAYWV